MSITFVTEKTALLQERTVTHCTREAATLLLVHVSLDVMPQAVTGLEGRSTHCTWKAATLLKVHVIFDMTLQDVTVLEGRAAQVARPARRDFNTPNQSKDSWNYLL